MGDRAQALLRERLSKAALTIGSCPGQAGLSARCMNHLCLWHQRVFSVPSQRWAAVSISGGFPSRWGLAFLLSLLSQAQASCAVARSSLRSILAGRGWMRLSQARLSSSSCPSGSFACKRFLTDEEIWVFCFVLPSSLPRHLHPRHTSHQ